MCDGYYAAGEDGCSYSGLDEFLCEYVDGTMDPAVRTVFEEYLAANPALAEHIERLRFTRRLLCQYGCRKQAPVGLQARLRNRLGCEMMQAQHPLLTSATERLGYMAVFTSAVALMLAVGLVVGEAFLVEPAEGVPEYTRLQPAAPVWAAPQVRWQPAPATVSEVNAAGQPHFSSLGGMPVLFSLQASTSTLPADTQVAAAGEVRLRRMDKVP